MKSKTLLFSVFAVFLAAAAFAVSLLSAPPASSEPLNVPALQSAPSAEFAAAVPATPASLPYSAEVQRPTLVAVLLMGATALLLALRSARLNALLTGRLRLRRCGLVPAINTLPANVGTSRISRRYKATAALATRNLFVKQGADDEHIAAIAATADKPVGVIEDEAEAAEDGIDVVLPGATDRTVPVLAGAAIATLNADMYTTALGKVVIKPTAAGTYWKVGRNKTLADAANDPVEVELCEPEKLTVIAALTSTNATAGTTCAPDALTSTNNTAGTTCAPAAITSVQEATVDGNDAGTTQALANSLKVKYNALQVDYAALHAKYTLLVAEAEKIGDDVRALHAKYTLLIAEAEKVGDDTRAIATGLNAAGAGVALATT